jgi:hypothetical protein
MPVELGSVEVRFGGRSQTHVRAAHSLLNAPHQEAYTVGDTDEPVRRTVGKDLSDD